MENKKELMEELKKLRDKMKELEITYPELKEEFCDLTIQVRSLLGFVYRDGKPFVPLKLP